MWQRVLNLVFDLVSPVYCSKNNLLTYYHSLSFFKFYWWSKTPPLRVDTNRSAEVSSRKLVFRSDSVPDLQSSPPTHTLYPRPRPTTRPPNGPYTDLSLRPPKTSLKIFNGRKNRITPSSSSVLIKSFDEKRFVLDHHPSSYIYEGVVTDDFSTSP